jgi:hypothetical protein
MNDIEVFLTASTFAVAGASQDRSKYGNKAFHALAASGRSVYPAIQYQENFVVTICTWLVWIELKLANLCH